MSQKIVLSETIGFHSIIIGHAASFVWLETCYEVNIQLSTLLVLWGKESTTKNPW